MHEKLKSLLFWKAILFRNLIWNCVPRPRSSELQISLWQLSRAEALVASVNQDDIRGREEIKVDASRLQQYWPVRRDVNISCGAQNGLKMFPGMFVLVIRITRRGIACL